MSNLSKPKAHRHSPCGKLQIDACFDAGGLSPDGGLMLLQEVEKRTNIIADFAKCFIDSRLPSRVRHSVRQMVGQRVYSLLADCEDVNDQDLLRHKQMLAAVSVHDDLDNPGQVENKALASSKTVNRCELGGSEGNAEHRCKRIGVDHAKMDQLLLDKFFAAHDSEPESICLDVDTTHDELHGEQQGSLFHGYYKCHCYLPLYIFCADHVLCSRLRTAEHEEWHGCLAELQRIMIEIRVKWPNTKIMIRGDGGFCREELMRRWEKEQLENVLGLPKNARLTSDLEPYMDKARRRHQESGEREREHTEFSYQTRQSWSRARRVIGKAECQSKGDNPRFVVTNIERSEKEACATYEYYCGRGDMENRIKEQKALYSDRTSTHEVFSNQTRMYITAVAHMLMSALRRIRLCGTELARAQSQTIRA